MLEIRHCSYRSVCVAIVRIVAMCHYYHADIKWDIQQIATRDICRRLLCKLSHWATVMIDVYSSIHYECEWPPSGLPNHSTAYCHWNTKPCFTEFLFKLKHHNLRSSKHEKWAECCQHWDINHMYVMYIEVMSGRYIILCHSWPHHSILRC